MELTFYVQGRLSSSVPSNSVILLHSSWNDWWKYETEYMMYYRSSEGSVIPIGTIKIGQVQGEMVNKAPDLPNQFQTLDPECFISLGQDTSYYEKLNDLGARLRESILQSLNDIALNLELFQKHEDSDVVKTSLTRFISTATVKNQFHRMALGGAKLTNYEFSYFRPCEEGVSDAPTLSFSVVPDSIPPTNIHVLIGRNGVGKTWHLKQLIHSIYHPGSTYGKIEFEDGGQRFSNIMCLAFSVFDQFPLQVPLPQPKYSYIGVPKRTESQELNLVEELSEQFASSLLGFMEREPRYCLWENAVDALASDPIFQEINLKEKIRTIKSLKFLYNEEETKNEIKSVFGKLSSGHKIVALTVTQLVEMVEECTLVLIDEPELHLHPPLLSAFIRALSQLLIERNGVAIMTTHSPVVLQEVPQKCAWIIRRSGEETVVERPSIETFGENVGVLTSEVFGLEVVHSGFHKMLQDVLTKADGDYERACTLFNYELGNEARAILKSLSLCYGEE